MRVENLAESFLLCALVEHMVDVVIVVVLVVTIKVSSLC